MYAFASDSKKTGEIFDTVTGMRATDIDKYDSKNHKSANYNRALFHDATADVTVRKLEKQLKGATSSFIGQEIPESVNSETGDQFGEALATETY